jgi:ABC-type transporter Mla subunit MlaD
MDPKPNASYGALISIVLILAIIVVGAFYVWGHRIEERTQNTQVQTASSTDVTAAQQH